MGFSYAYANANVGLGSHETALSTFATIRRRFRESAPASVDGHALKTLGRQSEAVDSYRRPRKCGRASAMLWSLANLKTYRLEISNTVCENRAPWRRPHWPTDTLARPRKALEDRADSKSPFAITSVEMPSREARAPMHRRSNERSVLAY